jgi:hypothetical protein
MSIPTEVKVAGQMVPVLEKGIKAPPKAKGKVTFDPKRPDLWVPPSDPARLADWRKLRAKKCKQLGIIITQ